MGIVAQMSQAERILMDSDWLADLVRRRGAARAEGFVADRVEEISDRLGRIDACHRAGAYEKVAPDAQRVSQLSAELGLTSLARVARDLRVVSTRGDAVAYQAVWERLVRIGDRSLARIWELPGLSM